MAEIKSKKNPLRKKCGNCLASDGSAAAPKLSACSRCGLVFYCSRDCQRAHWKANPTLRRLSERRLSIQGNAGCRVLLPRVLGCVVHGLRNKLYKWQMLVWECDKYTHHLPKPAHVFASSSIVEVLMHYMYVSIVCP